jgi:molecular chaperone Hsp33
LRSILQEEGRAELTCHFCNQVYGVEAEELQSLIAEFEAA